MKPLRALRTSLALAGALTGSAIVPAFGQEPAQLLKFRPVVEGAPVDYDNPTTPAQIAACKAEVTTAPAAYVLRDGQGKLVRRLVDTDGNKKLDQNSFFQDGFEIYRELDLDGALNAEKLTTIDEARWYNAAGTRVANVANNKIKSWKRISAEEASKVFVQAIVAGDADLLATVMARPEELAALGVPEGEVARVKEAETKRIEAISALRKGLVGWDKTTTWLRLDAAMPHLIPVEATPGLKGDLALYENAVIFAGPAGGGPTSAPDKMAFLQAGEIVKIGDTWKFVELPRAINPAGNAPVVASQGGIRTAVYQEALGAGGGSDPASERAIKALADYDGEAGEKLNSADPKVAAAAHRGRIPLLREVVKLTSKPDDKLAYERQVVDSIGGAYQTGQFPEGLKVLNALEAEGGPVGSYAAYRRVNAEFTLESNNPGANVVAVQKKWMNDMKEFLAKHAKSEEAPEVLFQLASNSEFNAEEKEARDFYTQLASAFPETGPGKKAAGAIKRLDLVGQSVVLKGKTVDGKPFDIDALRGKTTLVIFWATWAAPVKRDMPEIRKLYDKNKAKGFEVVGVCLDNEPESLAEFLKTSPLPWVQLYEAGGMDGRLATEFGIISLPTMLLIDGDGKVVNRSIRNAAELDVQLEKALAGKGGVALGTK